jgi:hypothetical protein
MTPTPAPYVDYMVVATEQAALFWRVADVGDILITALLLSLVLLKTYQIIRAVRDA